MDTRLLLQFSALKKKSGFELFFIILFEELEENSNSFGIKTHNNPLEIIGHISVSIRPMRRKLIG